jgi:membrane associated rhomboid family serine protease
MSLLIIAVNALVFMLELELSPKATFDLLQRFGLIPAKLTEAIFNTPGELSAYWPLITNLFLHGGWMHIIGNMWYIHIFGDNIEDRLGKLRFFFFYLICGIIANLTHVLIDPASSVPTIGASGAVSGILGAYLVTYPRAKVLTFIPIFFFQLFEIPALLFLGFWFIMQLQYGTLSLFSTGANIAWWAHIGGFIAGMVLIKWFTPERRYRRIFYSPS